MVALCECAFRGSGGKFRSINEARSQKGRTSEVRLQLPGSRPPARHRAVSSERAPDRQLLPSLFLTWAARQNDGKRRVWLLFANARLEAAVVSLAQYTWLDKQEAEL